MKISSLSSPALDRRPQQFLRDPALYFTGGELLCFHTTVEEPLPGRRSLFIELSKSRNFQHWDTRRLSDSPLNFSSPGNLMEVNGEYVLCLQSYPIPEGQLWADEHCRLYLMRSRNLTDWSKPEEFVISRPVPQWSASSRKIDPYLVKHQGLYYCLYKTEGRFGILRSADLRSWEEFTDAPVFSSGNTPDGVTVENPCLIQDDHGGWIMFFSPCRSGRGIGMAKSEYLIYWKDVRYLDLPVPSWAANGISAAMVLDLRSSHDCRLMAFHGEDSEHSHSAAIGFAQSRDLCRWEITG